MEEIIQGGWKSKRQILHVYIALIIGVECGAMEQRTSGTVLVNSSTVVLHLQNSSTVLQYPVFYCSIMQPVAYDTVVSQFSLDSKREITMRVFALTLPPAFPYIHS